MAQMRERKYWRKRGIIDTNAVVLADASARKSWRWNAPTGRRFPYPPIRPLLRSAVLDDRRACAYLAIVGHRQAPNRGPDRGAFGLKPSVRVRRRSRTPRRIPQ